MTPGDVDACMSGSEQMVTNDLHCSVMDMMRDGQRRSHQVFRVTDDAREVAQDE